MTQTDQSYKCNICGAAVKVTQGGAGELACCGAPMALADVAPAPEAPVAEEKPAEPQL